MARTRITEYDLLISCPGDIEEFTGVIEEAVKKFKAKISLNMYRKIER